MENISMFTPNFSNKSISDETSLSSVTLALAPLFTPVSPTQTSLVPLKAKRKRNQPGNPDPEAEVVALSPKTLVTTKRYICEICSKGFQRDQNLQLHRRGHNLQCNLKLRNTSKDGQVNKKVYVCPEPTCVHHEPSRALGDLTGIKKHYSRKHGEKKWRCERCGKRYAVQSDWKVHVKNCGTKEYRCDCGVLFSRKDSLVTHREFCDALAEESARVLHANTVATTNPFFINPFSFNPHPNRIPMTNPDPNPNPNPNPSLISFQLNPQHQVLHKSLFQPCLTLPSTISANTTVQKSFLEKDCYMGPTNYIKIVNPITALGNVVKDRSSGDDFSTWHVDIKLTRDFLGVEEEDENGEVEELMPLPLIFG